MLAKNLLLWKQSFLAKHYRLTVKAEIQSSGTSGTKIFRQERGYKTKQKVTVLKKTMDNKLTPKQVRAIPLILSAPNYTEGIKCAGVSRKTFYEWLKQPEFKAELDRQRNEAAAAAFDTLTQSLTKAVENLVGLLDNKDERLKRLACKDVIGYILEHKAVEDLVKRIEAIEQRLDERQ